MEKEKKDFIFGTRPIIEALNAGKDIDKIMVVKGLKSEQWPELRKLIDEYKIFTQYVPVEKLNKYTLKNHQGVIALLAPISFTDPESLIPFLFDQGKTPLIVVADEITDVRNFGAICRTSECAAVDGIIVPEKSSTRIGSDAVKTSAGAILKMNICKTKSLVNTIKYLIDYGFQIVSCSEKGDKNYTKVDYTLPTAIVIGSEEYGINPDILRLSNHKCYLPLLGEIDSLNVSVAAGIILYEAVNQRIKE